jgi:pimeloyl-ACP methyl ester carboxylesterase
VDPGLVRAALGETDRSAMRWAGVTCLNAALAFATPVATRYRRSLQRATTGFGGDILTYLVRGQRIRDAVRQALEEVDDRLVVVGHSLGGVAAVDVLVTEPVEQVQGLVTVGSQAPYLHAVNALPSVPRGGLLPAHLPQWINVFDPADLLSFVGERVFPGRLTDVELPSGVPFPRCHSAYFANPRLYELIAQVGA